MTVQPKRRSFHHFVSIKVLSSLSLLVLLSPPVPTFSQSTLPGCHPPFSPSETYSPSSLVSVDSVNYRCVDTAYALYCSGAGNAPPGAPGSFASVAWTNLGPCDGDATTTSSSSVPSDSPSGSPSEPPSDDRGDYLGACPRPFDSSVVYSAGDVVSARNDDDSDPSHPFSSVHRCKSWPYSSFCSIYNFRPGTPNGSLGWTLVGWCDNSVSASPTSTPTWAPHTPGCPARYVPGRVYDAGDRVAYDPDDDPASSASSAADTIYECSPVYSRHCPYRPPEIVAGEEAWIKLGKCRGTIAPTAGPTESWPTWSPTVDYGRFVAGTGSGSGSGGDDIPNDQDDDDTDPNTISNSNSNKIPNSNSTSKDEPRPRNLADNRLDPALLFVREKDLLSCLRNAVRAEQSLGTIRYHAGTEVRELDLDLDLADDPLDRHAGRLILLPSDAAATVSPPYHLVVAADGLHSSLRSRYAGHHSHNASTTGMDSTRDHREDDGAMASSVEYRWEHTQGQREATQVDDRKYVVFRGNAPKLDELHGGDDGSQSFQTWGEERSMRFAAVPFRHACDADSDAERERGPSFRWKRKDDEEVWFATLSDPLLYDGGIDAMTAERRKRFLLDAFGSWHEPVKTLVASTPAEKIMYETAVAHRYCASPVVDVARILEFERWRKRQERRDGDGDAGAEDNNDDGEEPTIRGLGPILVFVGDSCMTVDPVLAQGFTIAMEAGASLASSVETVVASSAAVMPSSSSEMANPHGDAHNSPPHPLTHTAHTHTPSIQQQTHKLKRELLRRHALRERRLIQLLRSTELVQIMAQPHGVMGGFLARWVVRPLMRYCPEVVKGGVFHWVIRYSLGLTGGHDGSGGAGAGGR
mmetsp:Transcript_5477/g.11482  ORF Transcript_5477/g.11482 Transcript_5477/m.11482 type:complete len:864 (-) Transcript_5477:32-2623(-)